MIKPLIRYTLLFLLLASASVAFQKAERAIDSDLLKKGLKHGFPGIILAVHDGTTDVKVKAAGLADIESKRAMKPTDRFHIASVTKLFTAVATLQLVDKNKLTLESKVTDLLDSSVTKGIPYVDKMTVGQLLRHTTGIDNFNNDPDYIAVWLGSKYQDGKK